MVLAAGALALAAAACTQVNGGGAGAGPARHRAHPAHVLVYADTQDLTTLNTHLGNSTSENILGQLAMGWLVRYGAHNEPIAELATEVPSQRNGGISKDGLTITWHLRKGVKWSDGVPFDADDIVFSTNVVRNPANNEISRDGWDLIRRIDEPDKYTVAFHLRRPYAGFLPTFFGSAGANPCVLPKHILAGLPNINHAAYNSLPVGIGPFRFVRWKRGEGVVLEANPYYWRGRPKLEKIVYTIVPDRNTLVTQLQTGDVDMWTEGVAFYIDRLRAIPHLKTLARPGFYFGHIDFNLTHATVREKSVREALRYALDRPTILEKVNHGIGILQESPVSPISAAYDPTIARVPFDIAKADALLEEAGWKRGADGVRVKNGVRLSIEFAAPSGSPDAATTLELIRANWRRIGVELVIKLYASALFFDTFANGGIIDSGKFDATMFSWGGNVLGNLYPLYACSQVPPHGENDLRYCNPKVDAAMLRFNSLYDAQARRPFGSFAQRAIVADVPTIVLKIADDIVAYDDALRGYHPNNLTPFDDMMAVDI